MRNKEPGDIPLNERVWAYAHNAYNQILAIPELLDMGVRALELDLQYNSASGQFEVYHRNDPLSASTKPVMSYIKDIKKWLLDNPNDIVIVQLEDKVLKHLEERGGNATLAHGHYRDNFIAQIVKTMGSLILPEASCGKDANGVKIWPSQNEMVKNGQRFLLLSQYKWPVNESFIHQRTWREYNNAKEPGLATQLFNTSTINSFATDCQTLEHIPPGTFPEVREENIYYAAAHNLINTMQDSMPEWINRITGKVPRASGYIEAKDIRDLANCHVSFIGLDKISESDRRLSEVLKLQNGDQSQSNTTNITPSVALKSSANNSSAMIAKAAARSFMVSFADNILRLYVIPSFIENGMDRKSAITLCEAASFSIKAATSSLPDACIASGMQFALHNILTQTNNLSEENATKISTILGATMTTALDPSNLIKVPAGIGGATAGEYAARQLIKKLPKFRQEPEYMPLQIIIENRSSSPQRRRSSTSPHSPISLAVNI